MEAQYELEGAAEQEGAKVRLTERLQMRGAPFFPLPPVEGEKRRVSETCAKVDSYMYMKHRISAPDLHQGAEGGLCSGSGRGRLGSGRGRPGSAHGPTKSVHGRPESGHGRPRSAHGRPGSGCGRPRSAHGRPESGCGRPRSAHGRTGSGCGLHTPGGGNVKIFSKRLPDFSHIQSRVDSSPPVPKESAMPQQRSTVCSAGVPLDSYHSKFYDHSYSKDGVTSLQNGPGEATSAPTRKNKSTSELSGKNKSPSECNGMHKNASGLTKMSLRGGRPLGTQDKNGGNSSEEKGRRSLERLGGRSQLLATPQRGVPLTCSDTQAMQELTTIRRRAHAKVDTSNPIPNPRDLFRSVAELTDRESFSVNVRFLLRPELVAAIFRRRRSFSEIDASATLDRRKARDVNRFPLKRSKSLGDLVAVASVAADNCLGAERASTLPRMWESQRRKEGIPLSHCGKVLPSEECVEGSRSEESDSENEGVDGSDRKTGGSHVQGSHGGKAGNSLHQSPGGRHGQPAGVSDRGRSVQTTPTKRTKADKSTVNCRKNYQQQKMALPLNLRRYTELGRMN